MCCYSFSMYPYVDDRKLQEKNQKQKLDLDSLLVAVLLT